MLSSGAERFGGANRSCRRPRSGRRSASGLQNDPSFNRARGRRSGEAGMAKQGEGGRERKVGAGGEEHSRQPKGTGPPRATITLATKRWRHRVRARTLERRRGSVSEQGREGYSMEKSINANRRKAGPEHHAEPDRPDRSTRWRARHLVLRQGDNSHGHTVQDSHGTITYARTRGGEVRKDSK